MIFSDKQKQKFFSKVSKTDKCWTWNGATRGRVPYGHVMWSVDGVCKNISAHRVSYLIHNGEIVSGNVVMHICDNPLCVNPDHLVQGTQKENVLDCWSKSRNETSRIRWSGSKNPKSKLDISAVELARNGNIDVKSFCSIYGVDQSTFYNIKANKTWK